MPSLISVPLLRCEELQILCKGNYPCGTGLKAVEGAHRKVVTSSSSQGFSQPLGFKTWEEIRDLQSPVLAKQWDWMGT